MDAKTLLHNGFVPKGMRCYKTDEKVADPYTIVFGSIPGNPGCTYVSSGSSPTHPQGFYQHGWAPHQIDHNGHNRHLGYRISLTDLPVEVQHLVVQEWIEIWGLPAVNPGMWSSLAPHIQERREK